MNFEKVKLQMSWIVLSISDIWVIFYSSLQFARICSEKNELEIIGNMNHWIYGIIGNIMFEKVKLEMSWSV